MTESLPSLTTQRKPPAAAISFGVPHLDRVATIFPDAGSSRVTVSSTALETQT